MAEMVVRESLMARAQLAPFYVLLAARTSGFSKFASDTSFVDIARRHADWSADEIEEALDHAAGMNDSARVRAEASKRENARLDWQKEFLEYLITERRNTDAARLIVAIEAEFKSRLARPAWLRLAKLRLDVRAGRLPEAVNGLKHFAGIEAGPRIDRVSPPSLERLNQATEMLRREGHKAEADELLRAAYERQLGMEQLRESSFVGLARLSFAADDAAGGLKLLKLMLDLAWMPTRSAAAAELAALPQVRARAVEAVQVEKPTADNQLMLVESLRLAAETAAEFGQFAAAIEYRRRMLELFPEDYASGRIELARALAANQQKDEAAKLVAMVIADRRASRQQRWMAVWVAPDAVRTLLAEQMRAAGKDQEMIAAVDALAAAQRGQAVSAAKSAGDAAANVHSNQLKLLQALLFRRSGQEREALRSFVDSLVPLSDSAAMAAFASSEDELRWQLVRLYSRQNQPRATLKLAETDERLRGSATVGGEELDQPPVAQSGLLPLAEQATERQRQSRVEMLTLLSASAEQTG
ncbi:MAG: hypothetical protein M3X11_05255, partial [Acidobacteriota bacterium]|nr:hypothetical protein [Acidobacteriota bacterium]